jgi:hypothetical protein
VAAAVSGLPRRQSAPSRLLVATRCMPCGLRLCSPRPHPRLPTPPAPAPPRLLDFSATAYSITGTTASGMQTRRGIVAADPKILPIGTRIRVQDAGRYSGSTRSRTPVRHQGSRDRHLHARWRGSEELRPPQVRVEISRRSTRDPHRGAPASVRSGGPAAPWTSAASAPRVTIREQLGKRQRFVQPGHCAPEIVPHRRARNQTPIMSPATRAGASRLIALSDPARQSSPIVCRR